MKLLVATDAHIYETPDGKHWNSSIYRYSFWTRYLGIFEEIRIVAKMKKVESVDATYVQMDGPGVEIYGIPFYQGPMQLVRQYLSIQKALRHVAEGCTAALMRMPSPTAQMVLKHLPKEMPVAGEVVYDPTDDVKRKGDSLFIHVINRIISKQLENFCATANGVSYVTEKSIQSHYPSYARTHGEDEFHFETYYSTITLSDEAFSGPRDYTGVRSLELALSCVAMENDRKGEKTLIRCVRLARERGYNVTAVLIGDGSKRDEFQKLAEELDVQEYVKFTGLLSSPDAVRERLKKADIFVFPTQAEGLPRGILEAMAGGMPVLSTPVGGIPEVLEKRYMFDPFDTEAFANAVCRLMDDPSELNDMSRRNFSVAKNYKNTILQERREQFYKKLKALVK